MPSATDRPVDRTSFDPAPSRHRSVELTVARAAPAAVGAVGIGVGTRGAVPRAVGLDRAALAAVGFEGKAGQTHVAARSGGPDVVAVGIGEGALTTAQIRDAAAAFARAVPHYATLATGLHQAAAGPAADAARAVVEGVVLARYRFPPLKADPAVTPVSALCLVAPAPAAAAVEQGGRWGLVTAAAAALARDLANSPPSHLTASRFADLAAEIAGASGLDVDVLGPAELRDLGCGGLLGVNAGSAEPPRLVKLTYRPSGRRARARLALVGKGLMYDSGGISLKPSDPMHTAMKMDMSGAAAVLAALSALAALDCPNEVVGYLMCTDNMPSGSAMKLGDVLHVHGGTTVEIHNTDAEGRLVLADGLVLAAEDEPDAIVDIATLTGAALVALGQSYAGVLGNHDALVTRLRDASAATDEPIWPLPLDKARYRKLLDSDVADLKNVGGPYGGAITAAVFLSEFVGQVPWAHLDIAPTMKADADESWRSKGATGFGTRLLIDFATSYRR